MLCDECLPSICKLCENFSGIPLDEVSEEFIATLLIKHSSIDLSIVKL